MMDSGMRAMVDAVDEARRQLRENALPKARERGRDKVPAADEPVMLGALADLVEVAAELAAALSDRMATHESPPFYNGAGSRLRDQARYLREAEQKVAERLG
ncbi:hypothetical protein ACH4E7_24770 [Kitasatospora sp. NPDC018058]|uniref:hypothetical protein n=1 Tax=Kitasatospora sp. NPDC018058 TaxID=3364025 RepID=UPI0037C1A282